MGFRERMRVGISNADLQVFYALQERLDYPMSLSRTVHLLFTKPDVLIQTPNLPRAIYLDGEQTHKSPTQLKKDNIITQWLEKRGYKPLRFKYKPPLPNWRLQEIVNTVVADIEGCVAYQKT